DAHGACPWFRPGLVVSGAPLAIRVRESQRGPGPAFSGPGRAEAARSGAALRGSPRHLGRRASPAFRSRGQTGGVRMRACLLVLAALGAAAGPGKPLAPGGATGPRRDAPKCHVEKITAGRHAYVIRQGGTMDGTNCRSPLGVGMMDGPA